MEEVYNEKDVIENEDGSLTIDDITIPPAPIPALTVEAGKERLIITELVVKDFKSYAGCHVIGPFHKNFSCIVGPNGSGKSNVIDALLFVFGYRAQKIRSKKVSVLIHKSHKYPNLDSCSVTVRFATIKDKVNGFQILPDSVISITRTAYQNNSSTYDVDGRRSQYKDVAILLRKYGVDLDYNRFMILQGEIELISMMKPKAVNDQESGMLEYIEDIIGTNRFIKPIQHFHEKVEKVNELRLEKLNQVKIIEKERTEAEKPRNDAIKYLKLANEVTHLENSALQAQIKDASDEDKKIKEEKDAVTLKIDDLSKSLCSFELEKKMKEMELRDINVEYEERMKQVGEVKKEFTSLEQHDATCRENVKNNKEKVKKLTKQLETEESKVSSLRKQPDVLRNENQELELQKLKLEEKKKNEEKKLEKAMVSVKDEIKQFQEEKDGLEEKLVSLKETYNEKKSEFDLAKFELDLILSSEKKEKEVLETLKSDYDKALSDIKKEEINLKSGNAQLPNINSLLLSARQKLEAVKKKETELFEQLKSKRNTLDEMKTSLNQSESRNTLVKAFMEQKRMGKLKGVFGRLGDLGSIEAKYDVAISTACGPLDNIVTDTMTTAQECVEFLKANNLGYATFIALDQMKKWEPYTTKKVSTPENVPRLFDLIKVKDKSVLTAFYYALRDTLVADNLDQATRVGLQGSARHRVVTLKGELIDLSGTMSGGGGKSFKGRMGQSVVADAIGISQEKIDSLSVSVENISKELEDVKASKLKLHDTIEEYEKEVITLQHSLKKSKLNYESHSECKKMLEKQIEEQKRKVEASAPDIEKTYTLEANIKKIEKDFIKAKDAVTAIENQVKGLQEKILSITKGKYSTVQKAVDKLEEEIKKITMNITKNTGLLKNTSKNLEKAENKLESIQTEIDTCQKTMETLKAELKDLEVKGIEVTNKKKELEELLSAINLQKSLTASLVKEVSTKMFGIKNEITDLKNKSKLLDVDARTNNGKLKLLKEKLSKLEIYDIDGDVPTILPTLTEEEMAEIATNKLEVQIGKLKSQIKDMRPDLGAIAEFKRKEEMYRAKVKDLDDVVEKRNYYRKHYDNLRKLRLQEFMRGFSIITLKVKELYQMMTLGGDAELELVDSLDPFSEGIEFSVRPFRKSWKSIRNLSGGEKTLSSLSLVFALHYYRTTPFFVMDEIDAALDFRNVSIIGSYIKDSTKNAQFIVISLRENMFLLADHLIGIYKTNNRTKNVYLSPQSETTNSDASELFEKVEETAIAEGSRNSNDSKMMGINSLQLPEAVIPDVSLSSNHISTVPLMSSQEKTPSSQSIPKKTQSTKRKVVINEESNHFYSLPSSSVDSQQVSRQNCTRSCKTSVARTPNKRKNHTVTEYQWSDDEDFVVHRPNESNSF